MKALKQLYSSQIFGLFLKIGLKREQGSFPVTAQLESAHQERLNHDRLAMSQLKGTLRLFNALVQHALAKVGIRKNPMSAPGGRLGFHRSMEVLSRLIGLAFPHQNATQ
ncbi:MAG TPA: hypothetical protein VGR55_19565 [Candidatus Acidoferrum sp.]|nr:hypothetical protein [Candidatus Acidoferrum sp.]